MGRKSFWRRCRGKRRTRRASRSLSLRVGVVGSRVVVRDGAVRRRFGRASNETSNTISFRMIMARVQYVQELVFFTASLLLRRVGVGVMHAQIPRSIPNSPRLRQPGSTVAYDGADCCARAPRRPPPWQHGARTLLNSFEPLNCLIRRSTTHTV